MASPAYELILEIQALDLSIDQLRHRAATHPERERLAEVAAQLAEHDQDAASVEESRHQLERDIKRLEDEVALIKDRRSEIEGKLYGGEIQASKELLALQDESQSLLDKQTGLEDQELELMEQLEEVGAELATRSEQRAAIETTQGEAKGRLDAAVAEIEAEIDEIGRRRADAASPAPGAIGGWDELVTRYDELRGQFDGVPVARLVDNHCDGCHIQLSAVAVDRMAKMPADEVVTCEECGRLLVR